MLQGPTDKTFKAPSRNRTGHRAQGAQVLRTREIQLTIMISTFDDAGLLAETISSIRGQILLGDGAKNGLNI